MIDDFDNVKKQLSELSDVINKFTSEAVQLKIVEIVLMGKMQTHGTLQRDEDSEIPDRPRKRRKARKARVAAVPNAETLTEDNSNPTKLKAKRSAKGALATLSELVDSGYFNTPKSIGETVTHCDQKLARKFKSNELSPALARLVRNNTLDREKNSENQYEYSKK